MVDMPSLGGNSPMPSRRSLQVRLSLICVNNNMYSTTTANTGCQVASGTPVEAGYSDGLGGELQKLERMFRVKQSRGSRSPSEFEGSAADPDSLRWGVGQWWRHWFYQSSVPPPWPINYFFNLKPEICGRFLLSYKNRWTPSLLDSPWYGVTLTIALLCQVWRTIQENKDNKYNMMMSRCRHILQSLWFDDAGTRRSTGPNCQRSSSGSRDLWTTWVSSILHYNVLSLASQTAATPHCQEMIMKRWGGKILCFERSACWLLMSSPFDTLLDISIYID